MTDSETTSVNCAYCDEIVQVPIGAKSFFHRPCTPAGEEVARTQLNPGFANGGSGAGWVAPDRSKSVERGGQIDPVMAVGLLLALVGGLIAGFSWPHTTADSVGNPTQSGSTAGVVIGLVIAGIGETLVMVAVIAYGVLLGMSAYRNKYRDPSPSQPD